MFLKSVNECGIPDLSDSFFTESFEDQFLFEGENFIVKAVKSFFTMLGNAVRALINFIKGLLKRQPIPDVEAETKKAEAEAKKEDEEATKKASDAGQKASTAGEKQSPEEAEVTARTNKHYASLPQATAEDSFADLEKKAKAAGLTKPAERMADFIERLTAADLDAKDPMDAVTAFSNMIGDITKTDDADKISAAVDKGMKVLDKFVVDRTVRKTSDATMKSMTVAKLQKVVDYHVSNVNDITKAAETFLAAVKSNESLFTGKVATQKEAAKMIEGYRLLSKKTYLGLKQAVTVVTKRHSTLVGMITPLTKTIAYITSKLTGGSKNESADSGDLGLITLERDFELFIC